MENCKNNCNCKKDEKIPQKVQNDFAYVCMSRALNKLIAIVIVCIFLLFASNAAWLYAWCQYDYSSDEIVVEQDAKDGGNANYIGNDGDIVNGLPESDSSEAQAD